MCIRRGTAADQQILFWGSQVYYNTDGYEKPLSAPNILTLFIPNDPVLYQQDSRKDLQLQGLQRQYQQRQCTGENGIFAFKTAEWGATGQRVGKSIVTTVVGSLIFSFCGLKSKMKRLVLFYLFCWPQHSIFHAVAMMPTRALMIT